MDKEKEPHCCAECKHSNFIKYETPLCTLALKELEHNTAKSVAVWCPLKLKDTLTHHRGGPTTRPTTRKGDEIPCKKIPISTFVSALGDALARGDGYIMGAYGQNPRTGYLDLSETKCKSAWEVSGWYYTQYLEAPYTPEQYQKALYWREHATRV